MMGLGGGTVSAEAQKNLEKAEDLCRRKKPEKALPYLYKAMEDDNNLDAMVQMAFLMPTLDMSICLLEAAAEKGCAALINNFGPKAFDDDGEYVTHFWGLLETRPYMRVLQALVRLYFENKQFDRSSDIIIEMLRLCPGDNLGQRDWLGLVLLKANRPEHALSFVQVWLSPAAASGDPLPRGGCIFGPPSKEPLPQHRVKTLSKYTMASMPYTGALACYALWGDCKLARQYLIMGATLNPHILRKILAKVDQPQSLNCMPRSSNGPEDAHDYLWLGQDIWMQENVWNWANNCAEAKQLVLQSCSRTGCGKREVDIADFKRCGACKEARYCGPACQKEDWQTHKPECQRRKQQKEILRAMMRGGGATGPPVMSDSGFTALHSATHA